MSRRLVVSSLASVSVLLMGCYTLEPITGPSPAPGSRVAFSVNDVGRVALGGSMGPEIDQVEGTLIQRDNGDYFLGVNSVTLLRGGVQVWKGEQVHIKNEYFSTIYERKLSKPRTIALAAATAGAIVLIASQNLLGAGDVGSAERPRSDSGATSRSPVIHLTLWSFALPRLSPIGRP